MQSVKDYGLTLEIEAMLEKLGEEELKLGRIITCYSSKDTLVVTDEGILRGFTAGKVLKGDSGIGLPVPGDWVGIRIIDSDTCSIEKVCPRKSVFSRKKPGSIMDEQIIGVNLDKIFLVTSMNYDFNPRRLERYISQASKCNIELIIVLSKSDLVRDPERFIEIARKIFPGGEVITTTATEGEDGISSIYPYLGKGETIALVGSSGVGKSTIINALLGSEELAVGEISDTSSKGRHTSTRREIKLLRGGSILLDTPGMREFGISVDDASIEEGFPDILQWADYCKYSNCQHNSEAGCAVIDAVENGLIDRKRYNNFKKITLEQDFLWVKGRRINKKKLKYGKKKG